MDMNSVTNIGLQFTVLQMAMLGVIVALFVVSAVKWLSKKPTGAFEVMMVAAVPVLLWVADFFTKPQVQSLLGK
jgi:carbon starvation protein CstA